MMTIAERVLAIHRALERAGFPHAFGGALALAYWTREPRGTRDIDVNVFVPADVCGPVLDELPDGIDVPDDAARIIARDGQTRLWWEQTPVDLFFDNLPIHADAAQHARTVPLGGATVQVIGPVELAVFKIMFDRTRDWADVEEMIAAETLDVDAVREALERMLLPDDPRFKRLDEAVHRATADR